MAVVFNTRALPYDVDEIEKNEDDAFKAIYNRTLTREEIMALIEYNPSMFLMIKDDETGDILSLAVLAPVTQEGYELFRSGQASDIKDIERRHICPLGVTSDYYFLESIATTKRLGDGIQVEASFAMIGQLKDIIYREAKYVMTSPVTREGEQLAQMMGFKEVGYDTKNNQPLKELVVPQKEIATAKARDPYQGIMSPVLIR